MGESQKPRKTMKPREMNPIMLVQQRGLNVEKRWVRQEDGSKIKELAAAPKGLVLGPVQTLVLATFIQAQAQRLEQLDALLVEALNDENGDDSA